MNRTCGWIGWLALLWLGCPLAGGVAAERDIVVPASRETLTVAVRLPGEPAREADAKWWLVESENPAIRFPAQIECTWDAAGVPEPQGRRLLAVIGPAADSDRPDSPAAVRRFRLVRQDDEETNDQAAGFRLLDEGTARVHLQEGDRNVLTYNYDLIHRWSVPATDARDARAGYIHPLWGLQGEVLTDDFPLDHFHHHGVFWGWPYVRCGDKTYDTWMATDIQQRPLRWLHRSVGPVAAVLGVENGWFDGQRLVGRERVWITAFRSLPAARSVDLAIIVVAEDAPITLQGREEKSYGGLTVRYDVWPRKDATVRTADQTLSQIGSGQASQQDLVNTPLPWADLSSRFPGSSARSGAAVFVDPGHPDYPPSWLTRTYGALCVGWPGIRPYTVAAGQSVTLDYRLWIHASELDSAALATQYQAYQLGLRTTCSTP